MDEPRPTVDLADEFHDAWIERGMRCEGTHVIGEALCQQVAATFAALRAAARPADGEEGLRSAILFGPQGITFPNLPHHPTGPDVLDAVAAWMDKIDAKDGNPNDAVQRHLREWASRLRAALEV